MHAVYECIIYILHCMGDPNYLASLFNKRRVRLAIISKSVYLELKMLCDAVKCNF